MNSARYVGSDDQEEINLNNVLLINPNNDEAIYMLINLKIEQSDYEKAKELIERFSLVCNLFCSKRIWNIYNRY